MKSVLLHGFNSVLENTWLIHALLTLIFVYFVGLCCVVGPKFQQPYQSAGNEYITDLLLTIVNKLNKHLWRKE